MERSNMNAIAKGVSLNLGGLLISSVTVNSALEPKVASGNVRVCDAGHPPTQVRAPNVCSECARIHDSFGEVPFQQLKIARPIDGGLVVLEKDELAEAKVDAEAFKKDAQVTAHPAEQVTMLTSTGDKMYFLSPDVDAKTKRPSTANANAYSALQSLVANHPELAFMTRWTPRTAMAQFQLVAYEGVLVLQERVEGSNIRVAPVLDLESSEAINGVAEQILLMPGLPSSVTDYDPVKYRDTSEERIAELIASKDVVPTGSLASVTSIKAGSDDLLTRLTAQLAAATAGQPKVAAKRAPAKKKATALQKVS
jgi:non-homologous end joining protein Ku